MSERMVAVEYHHGYSLAAYIPLLMHSIPTVLHLALEMNFEMNFFFKIKPFAVVSVLSAVDQHCLQSCK